MGIYEQNNKRTWRVEAYIIIFVISKKLPPPFPVLTFVTVSLKHQSREENKYIFFIICNTLWVILLLISCWYYSVWLRLFSMFFFCIIRSELSATLAVWGNLERKDLHWEKNVLEPEICYFSDYYCVKSWALKPPTLRKKIINQLLTQCLKKRRIIIVKRKYEG